MDKPSKIIDSLLVISLRSGDRKAFELLVKRWHHKLCFQAFRYTKDWQLAQDLVQDTWGMVIRKIRTLKDSEQFGSWAMTIVTRKALDQLKKNSKNLECLKNFQREEVNSLADDHTKKEKLIDQVRSALATLPPDQKMVLTLFYLEEYSLKEISAITQVSVNTVKTRLFRARERMKTIIKKTKDEKKQ